jgi:DNA-binding response OmpR family regulator
MSDKVISVLIVEDEAPLRKALARKCIASGFAVREARDGREGLEIALREKPGVILLDIIMPVMDGITMMRELRKDSWGKSAKVIALTNLSDDATSRDLLDQGIEDYLVKAAWTMEDVISRIKAIIS